MFEIQRLKFLLNYYNIIKSILSVKVSKNNVKQIR